jgi:tRNA threonylcarbamoyladenosine biosynthesis protein TsaE
MMTEPASAPSSATQPLWEIVTHGDARTRALGRRIGRACRGGEIFLLDGPMGAGKTCLAGGIALGLGIEQPAISPTFVIMRAYDGARGLTLFHFDFYRLGGDGDLDTIGLDDCFGPGGVILAEWPSRCPHAFDAATLTLRIEVTGEKTRHVTALPGGLPAAHLKEIVLNPPHPPADC